MIKADAKKIIAFVVSLLLVFCFTGCETFNAFKAAFIDPPKEITRVIKIGVLEPMTGADASDAQAELQGIELAHDLYPTLAGVEVQLIYADNQSDVTACPAAAQTLVDAGCQFIIGSYKSVLTLASSDVIKEARIPAIAVTNTNPIVTSTNNWYFRVCYIDSCEGQAAADFVMNGLNTTNAAILTVKGNDYAQAMAEEFRTAMGNDEIPQIEIVQDDPEFARYFMLLKEFEPDVVFFPGSLSQGEEKVAQSREAFYDFKFIGTKNWNGISTDNVYYTMDFDPNQPMTEMSTLFRAAYAKKYGTSQTPSDASALGFDAYLMIREVVEKEGPSASNYTYRIALSEIDGMQGATGLISMGGNGDPTKDILVEYKNGDSVSVVYTFEPERTTRTVEEPEEDPGTETDTPTKKK